VAPAPPILTVNGGSSSIKFALFSPADPPRRLLTGIIDRIGQPNTTLSATTADDQRFAPTSLKADSHADAARHLIAWLRDHAATPPAAIGHRVVHGGIHLTDHQLVTDDLLNELRATQPLDLAHLPREIALIEAFRDLSPSIPQVACFDTAFFRDLPRVAQLLPVPRKYLDAGVRRFGFHGLSYTYLMSALRRLAPVEADGKVILAHLGSGASMAAVHRGKPIDTTMAFTPTAGLVMGTRPGDLDPGLLVYLARVEKLAPDELDEFISHQCGLLGVSATTPDMRDLQSRRHTDPRATEAIDLFCYQCKKYIGAYAAALGGLDTLVFSGGIGEHSHETRAQICDGLDYLGLNLDEQNNGSNAPVVSSPTSRVKVRIIPTDEELIIAQATRKVVSSTSN